MSYLVIDTLQKVKDNGYRLWASCVSGRDCSHFADLDIDVLITHFGPDFPIVEGRERMARSLRCSKCGRKGVEVRISPNDTGGIR